MSLSQIYESGERQQDKGHFRNLVLIARADKTLKDSELQLLEKIGRNLGLTDVELKGIIANPKGFAVSSPSDNAERLEQIVNFVQMAQKDGEIHEDEMKALERVAVAIGYKSIDDIDVESILALVVRGEDTDVIVDDLL